MIAFAKKYYEKFKERLDEYLKNQNVKLPQIEKKEIAINAKEINREIPRGSFQIKFTKIHFHKPNRYFYIEGRVYYKNEIKHTFTTDYSGDRGMISSKKIVELDSTRLRPKFLSDCKLELTVYKRKYLMFKSEIGK